MTLEFPHDFNHRDGKLGRKAFEDEIADKDKPKPIEELVRERVFRSFSKKPRSYRYKPKSRRDPEKEAQYQRYLKTVR